MVIRRLVVLAVLCASAGGVFAQAKPVFSLSDVKLRKEICGPHPCRLEYVGTAVTPAGQPQVSIVRWPLCDAPGDKATEAQRDAYRELQTDYACGIGYFRVQHEQARIGDVRFVTVDSNAGPMGYGAGGGEESVDFDAKSATLSHEISGGSSSRWSNGQKWRVAPDFALIDSHEDSSSRLNLEWNASSVWLASTRVLTGSTNYNACRLNPKTRRWEVAVEADGSSIAMSQADYAAVPKLAGSFDWRTGALPDWLEVRADAKPGLRRHTVVTTPTSAPDSKLAMRLLWLDGPALLIEVEGADAQTGATSTRLELWWWEHPLPGERDCVLPPRAVKRGLVPDAEAGHAEDQGHGVPQVAQGVKQVLLSLDGVITPAFAAPVQSKMTVERAAIDGRLRFLVRWNDACKPRESGSCAQVGVDAPYAIALSVPLGKRQHLVSHTNLRFADPTSFAIRSHLDLSLPPAGGDKEWKQMIETRFKSTAKPR